MPVLWLVDARRSDDGGARVRLRLVRAVKVRAAPAPSSSSGGVDFLALVIGPPKHGKTTIAKRLVEEKLREGWWVFAHDVAHQYKACKHWRTTPEWSAAARAASVARAPFPRGASFRCGATEVAELAIRVGRRNSAERVSVPILLVFDESSLLEKSSASHISADDNALISTRRHKGIGLVYNLQRATQLHPAFIETATDVYVFRQPPQRLKKLEEDLSLDPGELRGLKGAPKFKFLHVRPGDGIVRAGEQEA